MTNEIEFLQNYLRKNNIDCYIVFTNDDHGSEYVVDYYKQRAFLSGFTGSAGTMLITKDNAYLWTDGRYFLQASEQLKTTGTILMKQGVEGVDTIEQFIGKLADSVTVAFDFKLATVAFVKGLLATVKNIKLIDNGDIIDEVWKTRPAMIAHKAYIIADEEAGETASSKLARTISASEKYGCKYAFISSLDDLAWLYNLRGNDIMYNPVNYAYSIIGEDKKVLYINKAALNSNTSAYFAGLDVEVKDYNEVYADAKKLNDFVLIDEGKTNYCLYSALANKKAANIFPTTAFKTVKNEVEVRNMIEAHKQDAVAVLKFMRWLKENAGRMEIDELSAQNKLLEYRKEGKDFLDLSFGTICGYKENGAVIHYSATEKTNKKITNESLLLVDSGAQYKWGTTDITRTFVLGELSAEQKRDFTNVLKCHIALAAAVFPRGVNGYALDLLCRMPLLKNCQNYNHGTGHGVGYLLNVHEGPQSINVRSLNKMSAYPFIPGMITSDEPGLYIEGKYGIRHESLILCVEKEKNEYGDFLGFEEITYVPFDSDGIDETLLTEEEKQWLKGYNKLCYETISPLVDSDLKEYLAKITGC